VLDYAAIHGHTNVVSYLLNQPSGTVGVSGLATATSNWQERVLLRPPPRGIVQDLIRCRVSRHTTRWSRPSGVTSNWLERVR